jgi:hypothetical protein
MFLSDYVKIYSGHDFGWHLHSFPQVYYILFDKNMEYAAISYRDSYATGGEIFLKKEGDTWIVFSPNGFKKRWIE